MRSTEWEGAPQRTPLSRKGALFTPEPKLADDGPLPDPHYHAQTQVNSLHFKPWNTVPLPDTGTTLLGLLSLQNVK